MNTAKIFNLLFRVSVLVCLILVLLNLFTVQPMFIDMMTNLSETNSEEILIGSVTKYSDRISSLAQYSGILGIAALVTFILALVSVKIVSLGAYIGRAIALLINLAAGFSAYLFFGAGKICCDLKNGIHVRGSSKIVNAFSEGFKEVADPISYTAAVTELIGWSLIAIMTITMAVLLVTSIVTLFRMRRKNEYA